MKLYKNLILILLISSIAGIVGCEKDEEIYVSDARKDRTDLIKQVLVKVNATTGYVGNSDITLSAVFPYSVRVDYKKPEIDSETGDTIGAIDVISSYKNLYTIKDVDAGKLSFEEVSDPIWEVAPNPDGLAIDQLRQVYMDLAEIGEFHMQNFQIGSVDGENVGQIRTGWNNIELIEEQSIACDEAKELNIRACLAGETKVYSPYVTLKVIDEDEEDYPELVIPVVFHVTPLVSTNFHTYDITVTSERMKKYVDQLNVAVSGDINLPNSGNLNVRFELAKYDPEGEMLPELGIHTCPSVALLGEEVFKYEIVEYMEKTRDDYFNANKSKLAWNPEQYLNIYMAPFLSEVKKPSNWLNSSDVLIGLESVDHPVARVDGLYQCPMNTFSDYGILIGIAGVHRTKGTMQWSLFDPTFELMSVIGYYYGLSNIAFQSAMLPRNSILNITDDNRASSSYATRRIKWQNNFAWDARNFMDIPSLNNVISRQQVQRFRAVLENCPTRGAYKVPGALELEEELEEELYD